jgi:hypothetical protein
MPKWRRTLAGLRTTRTRPAGRRSYVLSFPPGDGAGGKWLVSSYGKSQPRWRADGKELFHAAPGNTIMAVDVTPAPCSGPPPRTDCSHRPALAPATSQVSIRRLARWQAVSVDRARRGRDSGRRHPGSGLGCFTQEGVSRAADCYEAQRGTPYRQGSRRAYLARSCVSRL